MRRTSKDVLESTRKKLANIAETKRQLMEKKARSVTTVMSSVGGKEGREEGDNELKYEEGEPKDIDESFSEVMWAQGITLNIGNYESVRIDVSVKEYCKKEEKDVLLGKLKEFCVGAIKTERMKIEEYRKKRPS